MIILFKNILSIQIIVVLLQPERYNVCFTQQGYKP